MTSDNELEATGLLDGLAGQARQDRAELIWWLLDQGFTLEQVRGAFIPLLLAANRVIGDDGTVVSAQELSESSGFGVEFLQRLHRAVGLARVDDPALALHRRADAEAVLPAAEFVNMGYDPDQIVLMLRLLMDGLTQAAVAMRQAALQNVLRPGATELELAQAVEMLARRADPLVGPLSDRLLRLALRHSFQTEGVNAAERAAGALPGARDLAVAFADLVGFTAMGETLSPDDLARVASELGDRARDVATEPVQFVKTIGDAVMFVSPDPAALIRAVLGLVDGALADAFPRLRVGVAYGPSASHAGDWFGSPVNVASRVTAVAPPWAVYALESVRNAIGDVAGVRWTEIGPRQLKGLRDEAILFQATRSA